MRAQKSLSLLVASTLLLGTLSCGGSPHDAEESYFLISTNIKLPYWQAAGSGFYRAAREMKVKAEFVGPDTYDPAGQKEEFKRILGQKPTGILISVADPELLKPEIDAAIAQGIPVITIDSDAPGSKRLLFVGTNNYQAGLMGGRVAAEHLKGKANVAVFTMPEQANLKERLNGYRAAFADHPGIRMTEIVDIKGDPATAFDKAKEIATKRPDKVDAFICLEATAGKEVADVLDRHGVKGKLVMAMDTDEGTLEWIKRGVIVATIAQKPSTMGFFGLKLLDDLHHHPIGQLDKDWAKEPFAPIPTLVDTGATLIDKNNVDAFLRSQQEATAQR